MTAASHRVRIVFALLCALLLSACGFQLREQIVLPAALQRIALEFSDPFTPLRRDLASALERAGAEIVAPGTAGVGVLRVPVESMLTEPLTVSEAARVQEYIVRHRVEVEIVDAAGKVLLPRATIELTRDYSFDETQALGAAAEDELLRKELQREMVQQVLRRIETLR